VNTQKGKLENECVLLFQEVFDTNEIHSMLQNEDHPLWKDAEFQTRFREHLGTSFEPSLGIFHSINQHLMDIESEIKRFMSDSESDGIVSTNLIRLSASPSMILTYIFKEEPGKAGISTIHAENRKSTKDRTIEMARSIKRRLYGRATNQSLRSWSNPYASVSTISSS
jgi:hypothetical protein